MKSFFVIGVLLVLMGAGAFFSLFSAEPKLDTPLNSGNSNEVVSLVDPEIVRVQAPLLGVPVERDLPSGFSKQSARVELQRILKMSVEIERDISLEKLYQKWMQLDAYDALKHIDKLDDDGVQNLLYIVALGVWAKDNTIAFNAWLQDGGSDDRHVDALLEIVLNKETEEELAIGWVDYVDDLVASEEAKQKIMDRWVVKDPEGIVRWSLTTVSGRALMEEVFQTMTRDSAENAFIYLALLEDEKQSLIISALGAIQSYLTVEALNQNVMFAIQMLPDNTRSLTLLMAMPFIAETDNPGEIGAMIEALPDNYTRTVMLESLAYIWAKNDPESAAQFALTLPKSERQAQVVSGVVSQWHLQDLPAASEWLNSVRGDSVDTDMAANHLASHAAAEPEYVQIAVAWVDRIVDPAIKKTATQDVAANWIMHDEELAAEFMREQAVFSPEKTEWFIQDQLENKRLNQTQEAQFNSRNN